MVSAWLVVGDSELRALLLAVGEEAGIPMAAIEPDTVGTLLNGDERPEAMLISQGLAPMPLDPARLEGIERLAIASGDIQPEEGNGFHPGNLLKLPASLEDVERTLHWLAGNGQLDPSPSNATTSRLA